MNISTAQTGPAKARLRNRLRMASMAAVAFGLAACANISGIEPTIQLRDAATLSLPVSAVDPEDVVIAPEWWRAFGDERLNRLIALSIANNPSLKLVQSRLTRARAVSEVADAALLPQVSSGLDATRQLYTRNGAVPAPLGGSERDTGTLQLSASWEFDFFGKNRAALDAAVGAVRAAEADAQAARILLATQVARTYFQSLRLNDQLAVARRTLAQREETLTLVRDRVNAGLDTRLELRQSEGALPEVRQQIEALQEQQELTQNALAALIAEPNRPMPHIEHTLLAIQNVATVTSMPADLLGRRADIVAARWRVEAARQDVRNAKAQFYPNINLMAFAGFSSIGLDRLLDSGSAQWGVGPALRLPIFEGGRLRANLTGKTADYDAAVASYNATVIDAIHEAADQLASASSVARQRAQQQAAQDAAENAFEIAVQRYKAGLGNYLNVLAAETSVLNQRRLAVDLSARALDARVGLIRAMGGGYLPDTAVTLSASSIPQATKP